MIRHLVNLLLWGLPPTRLFAVRRMFWRIAGIDLGDGVSLAGRGWIYGRGALSIGCDTWLSPGCILFTHEEASIRIGERCDIGPNVEFITGSHEIGSGMRRAGVGTAKAITVGDGCWIGAGSRLLGGIRIGTGTIVAAGSVVTTDLPDDVLAAGVPARVKKTLG